MYGVTTSARALVERCHNARTLRVARLAGPWPFGASRVVSPLTRLVR